MHILLVHRYYSPDVGAYPQMLRIMADRFLREGHRVSVFSTQPGYNNVTTEKLPSHRIQDGVEEFRVGILAESKKNMLVRAVNIFWFLTRLIVHCLFRLRRYDLITVASFPPTVTAMVVRWLSWIKGCRYLYHCQDIYPEIAQASGIVKRKWLADLAMSIDRRNCRRAAALVTLSSDMTSTLKSRGLTGDNFHVINNFIIDQLDAEVDIPDSLQKQPQTFRVLFAGNLGRFQHLDQVMQAAKLLASQSEIHFYFVGAGVMESELKSLAAADGTLDRTVFFRPFQPLSVIMRVIYESDLSIVSLMPGVIDCAYPSKTMSYLESGCRILGMVEPTSELAQLIHDQQLGIISDGMSAESIRQAVEQEFDRWKTQPAAKEKIRRAGRALFGKEAILNKWTQLLGQLEKSIGQQRQ